MFAFVFLEPPIGEIVLQCQCCMLLIIVTTKATLSPTQGTQGRLSSSPEFLLSSQFWVDTLSISVQSVTHNSAVKVTCKLQYEEDNISVVNKEIPLG